MTWRMVAAVFETADGIITVGGSPEKWAEKIMHGPVQETTRVSLNGNDIEWDISICEMYLDHPDDDEDAKSLADGIRKLHAIRAETERVLAAYAPLREKEATA